jgi:hypothetical protein
MILVLHIHTLQTNNAMTSDSDLAAGAGAAGDFARDEDMSFVPALLVVDMQEDFCPPVSELAIALSSILLM